MITERELFLLSIFSHWLFPAFIGVATVSLAISSFPGTSGAIAMFFIIIVLLSVKWVTLDYWIEREQTKLRIARQIQ